MNVKDLNFLISCDDTCFKVHIIYDTSYRWLPCKSYSNRCRHFRSCSEHIGFNKVFK